MTRQILLAVASLSLLALGPARYGDRCYSTSEIIGHPLPGVVPDEKHAITNDYPVGAMVKGSLVQIGDLYPTVGGRVYFVPTADAYRRGLATASDNTTIPVGRTNWLRAVPYLDKSVAHSMLLLLKPGVTPRFIADDTAHAACFSSDWDGSYKKP